MRARIIVPAAAAAGLVLLFAGATSTTSTAAPRQASPPSAPLQEQQQPLTPSTGARMVRPPGMEPGALLRPEAERFVRRQGQQTGTRETVCRGATIPAGFIVVDDSRDRTKCGGENPATYNAYNVWVIERFDNRPAGSVMEICAATPTPTGWTLVDVYREVRRCGRPQEHFIVNVKRIRRTS